MCGKKQDGKRAFFEEEEAMKASQGRTRTNYKVQGVGIVTRSESWD